MENDSFKGSEDKVEIEEYPSSPRLPGKASMSTTNPLSSDLPLESSSLENSKEPSSESSSESGGDEGQKLFKVRKWPTRWYWQFLVLLVRTFRQSRHIILSKLNLVQTILLTVVSCIVWFQLPNHEDNIPDRLGYVSVENSLTHSAQCIIHNYTIAKILRDCQFPMFVHNVCQLSLHFVLLLIFTLIYSIRTCNNVALNGLATLLEQSSNLSL